MGIGDSEFVNLVFRWREQDIWMCSVVKHIGILNNALCSFFLLCKLHLAHFKCRKKVCTAVVNATLRQYRSCVHYIQYVILLGAVSKVACVFWPKCFWKCDVKRETYKKFIKNRFSEIMSCEQLAIFHPKFCLFSLRKIISAKWAAI